MSFNVEEIRAQFPILKQEIDGNPLVYLDSAATTQKPQAVIDAIVSYYTESNANVHRGAHYLADKATRLYEGARDIVATFIHAAGREEVIWTSGTTESINIVANGLVHRLSNSDEVVVTEMEHHANLVTWQQACKKSGATLKIASMNDKGELDVSAFESLINKNTKLVALPQVSNALGTINPLDKLIPMAKAVGALVLIDGAQGVAHGEVDVQSLGCDFYIFSGHKLFGPTGIGVLWGKSSILESWPVWLVGGEMIAEVTYQDATWGVLPNRLEAGTPNMAGAIGLGAAIKWFKALEPEAVLAYEQQLMQYATEQAEAFDGLTIVGQAENKVGVLSFNLDGHHPADVGFLLDKQGIAIRTGDHCAQPLMSRLDVPGTARASFSVYTTRDDIDALFNGLEKVKTMLG